MSGATFETIVRIEDVTPPPVSDSTDFPSPTIWKTILCASPFFGFIAHHYINANLEQLWETGDQLLQKEIIYVQTRYNKAALFGNSISMAFLVYTALSGLLWPLGSGAAALCYGYLAYKNVEQIREDQIFLT